MNEDIKIGILLFLSPVLLSIIAFWFKKFINKTEQSLIGILKAVTALEIKFTSMEGKVTNLAQATGRLEASIENNEKRIDEEVSVRNKKFDRQSDMIIAQSKDIAVMQNILQNLKEDVKNKN